MLTVTRKLQFFNYFEATRIEKTRQSQENSNFSRFLILKFPKMRDRHRKTANFLILWFWKTQKKLTVTRKNKFFHMQSIEKLVFPVTVAYLASGGLSKTKKNCSFHVTVTYFPFSDNGKPWKIAVFLWLSRFFNSQRLKIIKKLQFSCDCRLFSKFS